MAGQVLRQLNPLAHGEVVGVNHVKYGSVAGGGNLGENPIVSPIPGVAADVEYAGRIWKLREQYPG